MAHITFRNSKIIYYGPQPCENCGVLRVKAGSEWGGTVFTYPEGPIYPNSEWHPHICDPSDVARIDQPPPVRRFAPPLGTFTGVSDARNVEP